MALCCDTNVLLFSCAGSGTGNKGVLRVLVLAIRVSILAIRVLVLAIRVLILAIRVF